MPAIKSKNSSQTKTSPLLKVRRPDPVRKETLELRHSYRETLKRYRDFLAAHEEGPVSLEMVAESLVDTLSPRLKVVLPDPVEKETLALKESSWRKLEEAVSSRQEEFGGRLTTSALFESLCAVLQTDKAFREWEAQRNAPQLVKQSLGELAQTH